jgi:EAL domain-containing protein (putative c-di-GMP-specific phosphodiesterase class I)
VKLGCDYLQGYLFGPPTSAEQVEAMLRRAAVNGSEPLALSA